jgi:prevent-host-death family protein
MDYPIPAFHCAFPDPSWEENRMENPRNHEASIEEAKTRLSAWVRHAEHGESVVITRRGKPVAALVSAEDLMTLERLKAAGPDAGLAGLAGGWEASEELADLVSDQRRSPSRESQRRG